MGADLARIRSIHPSLWTDEDFVSLSMTARLFMIGLWNEADDYGILEWKPIKLKMRIFPNDQVNVIEIMSELSNSGFLVGVERDGRIYGIVKNFRKYQRPQKPGKPIVPIDDEIGSIICVSDSDKISFPDHYDTGTIKVALMEEGGDNRKGKEDNSSLRSELVELAENGQSAILEEKSKAKEKSDRIVNNFLNGYAKLAVDLGLPTFRAITDTRRSHILARAKNLISALDFSDEQSGFNELFEKIRVSPFLRGERGRGSPVTVDWVTNETNFLKIMEGNYEKDQHVQSRTSLFETSR